MQKTLYIELKIGTFAHPKFLDMIYRRLIIIALIISILGGSYLLAQFFISLKKSPPEQKQKEQARAVRVDTIQYSDITSTVFASGRLGSQQYVDVIAEVQGEILPGDIPMKKGQNFRKGDLLFRVFDMETAYSLKASKSRFLNVIANALPDFKIDYQESYDKWRKFFNTIDIEKPLPEMPEPSSDQEKTFLASRNILNDYYSIKSAEIRLNKHYVRAPFKGSFTEVFLESSSIANPGSRVARIIKTDKLELEVPVDIEDVKWISVGDEVLVNSEDKSKQWEGEIVRVSDFVDPGTQSVSVFINLNSSLAKPLYEGQYLEAVFSGKVIEDAMEIPRRAVFNSNEVFIVLNGELHKQKIDIHKVNQETLIFNGIESGVPVVVEPLVNVPEKAKVKTLAAEYKLNSKEGKPEK